MSPGKNMATCLGIYIYCRAMFAWLLHWTALIIIVLLNGQGICILSKHGRLTALSKPLRPNGTSLNVLGKHFVV